MELPTAFADFLSEIGLQDNHISDLQRGHSTLRTRLENDIELNAIIVSTFLQGSYRRSTAIRPKNSSRADVDVVVVTTLDPETVSSAEAMERFVPFLDKHYEGKYIQQGRSIGIELTYVEMDLVITARPSADDVKQLRWPSVTASEPFDATNDWRLAPSWIGLSERARRVDAVQILRKAQSESEWQGHPLLIPDIDLGTWEQTHPLAQIAWTRDKNSRCHGQYVRVVKALKWWRKTQYPSSKYPKGYPLEHLIGQNCPDSISSVAEGVTRTLEAIVSNYSGYAQAGLVPILPDHGVPKHNVLHRLSSADFADFYAQVSAAAPVARQALDAEDRDTSAQLWRALFGSAFPYDEDAKSSVSGGFTPRTQPTRITGSRFA